MYGLTGGGGARRMVTLANAFAERGDMVDLLLVRTDNVAGIEIDDRIEVIVVAGWTRHLPWIHVRRRRQFEQATGALTTYMQRSRPDVLIAADVLANLTALEAGRRADHFPPLILTQRTHTSTFIAGKYNKKNGEKLRTGIERLYPEAEAIIGVSEGVSADLIDMGLPEHLVRTIYNPVIGPDTARRAAEAIDHPWFAPTNHR